MLSYVHLKNIYIEQILRWYIKIRKIIFSMPLIRAVWWSVLWHREMWLLCGDQQACSYISYKIGGDCSSHYCLYTRSWKWLWVNAHNRMNHIKCSMMSLAFGGNKKTLLNEKDSSSLTFEKKCIVMCKRIVIWAYCGYLDDKVD